MSRSTEITSPCLLLLRCVSLVVLGSLSIIATGCGGSDDDGAFDGGLGGDDNVIILPTYGYQVSAIPGAGPLTVNVTDESGVLGISVDFGNTLNGDVNINVDFNNNISIVDYTLQSLSSVTVDSDVGDVPFLGAFDAAVTEDLLFMGLDQPPNAGVYEVLAPDETITVQVNPGGAFGGGVDISLNGGLPITLSWDELEDLLNDDLALAWQRRAALATEVLEFVLIQVFTITDVFNVIDDGLLTINPAVVPCDAFTGTPPPGVLNRGETRLTWFGPGSVPIGGDDFQWDFQDCWFDDTGSGFDTLVNGSIGLNDYVEIIDGQFRLIGSGFNEVIYNNLEVAGTVENPPGTFTIDPLNIVTINGSFDLAFVGITN